MKLMKYWVLLLVLVGCAAFAPATQEQPVRKLVYGLTFEPSGFDPHINQSSELGIPLRSVYDTLVYRDPQTKAFVPGLAESWIISPDGLEYTFKLKTGVTFHDGTAFDAAAVAANLDRITSPETASQKALFMLGTYERYEIIDANTIKLVLSQPYSPLLDSLSQVYLGIASPKALREYSVSRYQFYQVGTGPFMFVDYIPGDHITLKRNPNYTWGPSFYQAASEQSVDEIEFRFFFDPATRATYLSSGQVQVMGEILPVDGRNLIANNQVQLIETKIPGQPLQFMLNTTRFPTDNLMVRQALLVGTRREAIIDAVFQRFSPTAWGALSATSPYYDAAGAGRYSYDKATAQGLLAQAGFTTDSDQDGYLDLNGVKLEMTMIVPPYGFIPEVAQMLQQQWKELGVQLNLEPVANFSGIKEKVNAGAYNFVPFYSFGLDASLLNSYYITEGANNWMHFSDATLDQQLLGAAEQLDDSLRDAAYVAIQRTVMDQALILPIRDYVNLNGVSAKVQNLAFDAYGWFPILNNVTLAD